MIRELDTVVLTHDIGEYGLKQGDMMSVLFNAVVKIKPPPDSIMRSSGDTKCVPLSESIDVKGGEIV